jgi:hypothetical protein
MSRLDESFIKTLQSFLAQQDPGSSYTFEKCPGGNINITVRAFRNPRPSNTKLPFGISFGDPNQELKSFIVKYAPPYCAAVGPELPFSSDRQLIEAAALSLLNDPNHYSNGTSFSSSPVASAPQRSTQSPIHCRNYNGDDNNSMLLYDSNHTGNDSISKTVSIPKLYHFSEKDHLLVIEDLGKLRDLEEWIQLPQDLHRVRDVGKRLGTFVGRLHCTNMKQIQPPHEVFYSRIGQDLVDRAVVVPLKDYLDLFEIQGGERVYEIVVKNHRENANRKEQAELNIFSMGDFWPPSILLDDDKDRVAVVDWEFAGFALPMQDMVQLGEWDYSPKTGRYVFMSSYREFLMTAAHIHLHLLSACTGELRVKFETLLKAMREAYHGVCDSAGAEWTDCKGDEMGARKLATSFIRDAWILHGREMINNAAERDWEGCIPLDHKPSAWAHCPIRRRMAKIGSWYVDVAGKDAEEMLARWSEVEKEQILRGFYGLGLAPL